MKEKKTIYAVIVYPKNTKNATTSDFHIYSFQTSNKEKMGKFFREHKEALEPQGYCVHITTRENAKILKDKWYHKYAEMTLERERKLLAEYERRSDEILLKKVMLESMSFVATF